MKSFYVLATEAEKALESGAASSSLDVIRACRQKGLDICELTSAKLADQAVPSSIFRVLSATLETQDLKLSALIRSCIQSAVTVERRPKEHRNSRGRPDAVNGGEWILALRVTAPVGVFDVPNAPETFTTSADGASPQPFRTQWAPEAVYYVQKKFVASVTRHSSSPPLSASFVQVRNKLLAEIEDSFLAQVLAVRLRRRVTSKVDNEEKGTSAEISIDVQTRKNTEDGICSAALILKFSEDYYLSTTGASTDGVQKPGMPTIKAVEDGFLPPDTVCNILLHTHNFVVASLGPLFLSSSTKLANFLRRSWQKAVERVHSPSLPPLPRDLERFSSDIAETSRRAQRYYESDDFQRLIQAAKYSVKESTSPSKTSRRVEEFLISESTSDIEEEMLSNTENDKEEVDALKEKTDDDGEESNAPMSAEKAITEDSQAWHLDTLVDSHDDVFEFVAQEVVAPLDRFVKDAPNIFRSSLYSSTVSEVRRLMSSCGSENGENGFPTKSVTISEELAKGKTTVLNEIQALEQKFVQLFGAQYPRFPSTRVLSIAVDLLSILRDGLRGTVEYLSQMLVYSLSKQRW